MSLQKRPNNADALGSHEFWPNATGNKQAAQAAEKTKALLDTIVVDEDALLLAERNDVLDHAIERLGENGEHWKIGYLAVDAEDHSLTTIDPDQRITEEPAALMRERGNKFCSVGAIGAELGPHSKAAIDSAIIAVGRVLTSGHDWSGSTAYGFSGGGIFNVNDEDTTTGEPIVEAFRQAKSQPLRKS